MNFDGSANIIHILCFPLNLYLYTVAYNVLILSIDIIRTVSLMCLLGGSTLHYTAPLCLIHVGDIRSRKAPRQQVQSTKA